MSLELTENLYKEMNGFQICQFVVIRIHAYAEEQAGVTPVNDLVVTELIRRPQVMHCRGTTIAGAAYLDKVGLIFLVARGH